MSNEVIEIASKHLGQTVSAYSDLYDTSLLVKVPRNLNRKAYGIDEKKAKQIAADTGRDYQDVLNELYQTEIYRKKKDPDSQALDTKAEIVDSIIDVTSNMYGTPSIDKMQGELIYEDIMKFKELNPDAYSDFMRIKGKDKFVFATGQYEGSLTDGAQILKNSKLKNAPEGIPVYDNSSGKFIVRQGNIVKEYVSEKIEE